MPVQPSNTSLAFVSCAPPSHHHQLSAVKRSSFQSRLLFHFHRPVRPLPPPLHPSASLYSPPVFGQDDSHPSNPFTYHSFETNSDLNHTQPLSSSYSSATPNDFLDSASLTGPGASPSSLPTSPANDPSSPRPASHSSQSSPPSPPLSASPPAAHHAHTTLVPDPDADDDGDPLPPGDHDDELFFDGLSYPPHALDWCTTTAPAALETHSQNGEMAVRTSDIPPSETSTRVCVSDTNLFAPRVEQAFVDTFRMSSPYINAHQGLIFVIHIPGAILREPLFFSVMEDIALMRVVGIKLVLVLGPQQLVSQRMTQDGLPSRFVKGIRITDSRTLQIVKELAGSMRFEVECALAKGVTNMPSASRISVVSGNFFSAQPVGIIDGNDFGYTGKVRRMDVEAIGKRLDQGDIILLPNVGPSPSGQLFNCKAEEVAAECAAQLKAEKLIFMGNGDTLYDTRSDRTIPNMSLKSAARFLQARAQDLPNDFRVSLQCSVNALERGVRRAHILNRFTNGVLLMEVFHRDGVGLMVSRDLYEGFRRAKLKDVNGVKAIIRPLEEQGILKKRSRTMLERDIEKFVVIERDGMIIACLSLSVMEDDPSWAELGCVAVHRDYRKLGKGDAMLGFTERMAYDKGVRNLFVLSTQSFDWFHERGFKEVTVDDLPKSRQAMYDKSRRSKIFFKVLQGSRAVSLL